MIKKQICVAVLIAVFSRIKIQRGARDRLSATRSCFGAAGLWQCHAVQKEQTKSPNDDAPAFQNIVSVPGMTTIALSAALHISHQTMPNLVLDPNELADIVAYILSLK
jgi:hypothetical protein